MGESSDAMIHASSVQWQEARMHVNEASLPCFTELSAEDAHEANKEDKFHTSLGEP